MAIVLKDLLWEEGTDNMGGLHGEILCCPASDVEIIPAPAADSQTVATDIKCKLGKKFTRIYFTLDTAKLDDTEVGERDCASFENSLEWFTPGTSDELLYLKRKLNNGGFIYIVEDNNGVKRIVGSKHYPAYREPGSVNSGAGPKDKRGATFKVKSAAPHAAYIYTGQTAHLLAPAVAEG
ncbi:MAG: hypothetical protein ACO1OF_16425 [Adhaeribacter sp.]